MADSTNFGFHCDGRIEQWSGGSRWKRTTCFGEITKVEIATTSHGTVSEMDEDIGHSLAGSKAILAALQKTLYTPATPKPENSGAR
jgi:hypothetical protein